MQDQYNMVDTEHMITACYICIEDIGTHLAYPDNRCISPSKPEAASTLASSSKISSEMTSAPVTRPPAHQKTPTRSKGTAGHTA